MQFFASLAIATAALLLLIWMPAGRRHEVKTPTAAVQVVEQIGPRLIRVQADSALAAKLETAVVVPSRITAPAMRVTGTVAASLRPGDLRDTEYWQFDDPEVMTTFYEWERSQVDVAFAEAQKSRIAELNEVRIDAQRRIVERLERLVRAGTDTLADLELARAELLEREIEARRDLHEAETDVWMAQQEEAVLVRQLQVAGLEPRILREATPDVDVVVADVPEEFHARVFVGQQCEARFFGLPQYVFPGVVRSIAPVVSPERRSLRVLFFIDDPDDQLRPGMFADVGLGTEPRDSLLVPAEGLIHIGRHDYVFVQSDERPDVWQVRRVVAGDAIGGQIEIFSGVSAGERVVGQGAILLKPAAADSLQRPDEAPVEVVAGDEEGGRR